jgi:hypothetical protein
MFQEIVERILRYCPPTISLYLVSKVFRQISMFVFDPSINDNEAIKYASKTSNYDMLKRLVKDPRVNIHVNNNIVLRNCVLNNSLEMTNYLLNIDSIVRLHNIYETLIYCNDKHDEIIKLIDSKLNLLPTLLIRVIIERLCFIVGYYSESTNNINIKKYIFLLTTILCDKVDCKTYFNFTLCDLLKKNSIKLLDSINVKLLNDYYIEIYSNVRSFKNIFLILEESNMSKDKLFDYYLYDLISSNKHDHFENLIKHKYNNFISEETLYKCFCSIIKIHYYSKTLIKRLLQPIINHSKFNHVNCINYLLK